MCVCVCVCVFVCVLRTCQHNDVYGCVHMCSALSGCHLGFLVIFSVFLFFAGWMCIGASFAIEITGLLIAGCILLAISLMLCTIGCVARQKLKGRSNTVVTTAARAEANASGTAPVTQAIPSASVPLDRQYPAPPQAAAANPAYPPAGPAGIGYPVASAAGPATASAPAAYPPAAAIPNYASEPTASSGPPSAAYPPYLAQTPAHPAQNPAYPVDQSAAADVSKDLPSYNALMSNN